MCACVFTVCMCACVCTSVCVCACVCTGVCVCACVSTSVCVRVCTGCMCVRVCTGVCMCVHVCAQRVCVCIRVHNVYVCMCVHRCLHVCMCVHVCAQGVCVYMSVHRCMCVHVCAEGVCTCVCIGICMCAQSVCVYMCVHRCLCVHRYMCVHIVSVGTCTYVHVVHTGMHVCACTYVHGCVRAWVCTQMCEAVLCFLDISSSLIDRKFPKTTSRSIPPSLNARQHTRVVSPAALWSTSLSRSSGFAESRCCRPGKGHSRVRKNHLPAHAQSWFSLLKTTWFQQFADQGALTVFSSRVPD